jgi:hypothetical protein
LRSITCHASVLEDRISAAFFISNRDRAHGWLIVDGWQQPLRSWRLRASQFARKTPGLQSSILRAGLT